MEVTIYAETEHGAEITIPVDGEPWEAQAIVDQALDDGTWSAAVVTVEE